MVTETVVIFFIKLVGSIARLFPTWSLDLSTLQIGAINIGGYLGWANGYVPMTLLLACMGICLAAYGLLMLWRAVLFVYSLIPFI